MACSFWVCRLLVVLLLVLNVRAFRSSSLSKTTGRYDFNIKWKKVTRLCKTKQLLTVNGEYPGPTIAVYEGDDVEIKVTNNVDENTTIHWHGIRQLRTGCADGPAYITQCPIKSRKSYTYKFTIIDQRGTLWWHAHYSWQRASIYGAIVIYPRMPYPFSIKIHQEIPILLGEWWHRDVDVMEKEMVTYGGGPNVSDAYTINGLPGPLYPCSNNDTFIQTVEMGKTYMLRIINAAPRHELFFAIANHTLKVVEIDSTYTKPFTTKAIMITPGQTTNVLITADQVTNNGIFAIAAKPYITSVFPYDNSTTLGFLHYKNTRKNFNNLPKIFPKTLVLDDDLLPQLEDTKFATQFTDKLKSLATHQFPCKVPKTFDKRVITTVGLNLQDCPLNKTCQGYNGKRFFASMNNQSFVRPALSMLEYHYKNIKTSLLHDDFPENPPQVFNFTGVNSFTENMNAEFGTKLLVVPYGTNLEIVLQGTSFLNVENHPIHFHGYNFFIVGKGFGNFNVEKDPGNYNLVDPPERNTVGVPIGGWAAIRFKADNPGVWFVHCHLEEHTTWGLAMAIVVKNGPTPSQTMLPPPQDYPSC